jgi:putative sigma-54 modulation protein
MQLHVKGRNLEVSESIRRYAERKVGKLDRWVNAAAEVEVELAVEKNPSIAESQVAEATVRLKGHTLRAHAASRDMKAAIDDLADSLVRQVKEQRVKTRRFRRHTVDKHALQGAEPPES